MIRNSLRNICIIFLLSSVISYYIAFADADTIFKEYSKTVVIVLTYDEKGEPIAQGSGFIVRSDGAIVTNYHVISSARDIKIKSGDKVLDVEGLIYTDKENDLLILKAKGENLPIVKLGDIEKTNVGEKVYVISSPQGFENTISDGILSGIGEITPERKILQITAPVSPGSSGGPVFNNNSEVIGIATFIVEKAQNLTFAMSVNLIRDKIDIISVTALKDVEIEDYEKTPEYWFLLGYNLVEAGLNKEAIEAFKQAIRINPYDAWAHSNLGVAYVNLSMYKEAIEALKQAIRIYPNFAEAYYNLGTTYGKLSMYKEEIEAHKQAIRIKPDYAEAHTNLGAAYGEFGMNREAIEALKQAIKIKPDHAKAYYNLGIVYGKLGMYKEAIESCKQAINIKPDYAEAHYNLGVTYGKLGMNKEEIESYKQAIRIKPDYAGAHYNLGVVYGKLDMYREALEAYKQAIRVKPDYAEAHYNLGVAYDNLGMYREAIEALKQVIRIKPDYALAHLGLIYLNIGNKEMALEEYKILKDLDPEKAEKLFNLIYK